MNLDSGRVKQGSTQYNEDQIFFNSNAGEPKGRDVSEGLIGSDTTGKLSGLHHVLSFIANKVLKYPGREGKLRGREREDGKYLMTETPSIHFSLTENLAEK